MEITLGHKYRWHATTKLIINVVKYDVRDKLESDNIGFRCHIMHNPCKAKKINSS